MGSVDRGCGGGGGYECRSMCGMGGEVLSRVRGGGVACYWVGLCVGQFD